MSCKHISELFDTQTAIYFMVHADYSSFKVLKHVDMTRVRWPSQKENWTFACSTSFNIQISFFHFFSIKYWLVRPTNTSHCEIMSATQGRIHFSQKDIMQLGGLNSEPSSSESPTILHTVTLFGDILTVISKWGFGFIKLVYCTSPGIPPPDSFSIPGTCITHLPLITSPNWSTRFCHANDFLPNQIWMDWRDDNHSQWMDLQGT